ncbi:MAG: TOBE domain-containing protein [Geobacteraceae bacterium]|nr:TOBE domain-containing protein [Geobacteraceae bacterium]
MNISARNLLSGKVTAIKPGSVNTEIDLSLTEMQSIVAVITNESVRHLELKVGSEVFAIIKAPLVILAKGKPDMKFSTRNILEGTVKHVEHGTVNAEVSLELRGGVMLHSVITMASLKGMGLKAGDTATALFKASSVILAVRT